MIMASLLTLMTITGCKDGVEEGLTSGALVLMASVVYVVTHGMQDQESMRPLVESMLMVSSQGIISLASRS